MSRPKRLRGFSYRGPYVYALTVCTARNQPLIPLQFVVPAVCAALRVHLGKHRFGLIAYCFMPDHVHLTVRGLDSQSDLTWFVRGFKQASGYLVRKSCGVRLWQEGYFDHVLRTQEAVERHVKYILENPVRAKLVDRLEAWPYSDADLGGLKDFPRGFWARRS